MNSSVNIDKALCLPASDIQALTEGRVVAVISGVALTKGARFALYPNCTTLLDWDIQHCYHSKFWSVAYKALNQSDAEPGKIQYWVECQTSLIIDDVTALAAITALGIWQHDFLKAWLEQKQFLILAFLRSYQLPVPIEVRDILPPKSGKFIGLPQPIQVHELLPTSDEVIFYHQLEHWQELKAPFHPELEELEAALALEASSTQNLAAQTLLSDLRSVLGWHIESQPIPDDSDTTWMTQIAALGERSKDLDEGKSNYQAGTDFEIAVRNSLEYLGFKIDYAHRGGAGGLDLSCSEPYILIGECKSGKKIPNDTAVQLLNLGTLRLEDKEAFNRAAKLIIGPGQPTVQLEKAAIVHGMAIINPYTLENLVDLQHQYPGSIDLIELKKYLVDGRADDEVSHYITLVKDRLRLRALIVSEVKQYLINAKAKAANLDSLHAVYMVSKPPKRLSREEFHNILIELSSPLAGYLGREQDADGCDRFYFLRDLIVEPKVTELL